MWCLGRLWLKKSTVARVPVSRCLYRAKLSSSGYDRRRSWMLAAMISAPLFGVYIYYNEDHPVSLILSGIKRFAKTAMTAAWLISDYELTLFRARFMSTMEQNDALHNVHQRSANRLLWLFRQQGGVYIKAGQHISSLTYLLPLEYTKTLAVLQDDAPQSSLEEVEKVFIQELGQSYRDM
jgi:aarF domain-containing kinase